MKKIIGQGTKIDFVIGGHHHCGLEVDKVDPATDTIEVLHGNTRYHLGSKDIRRVY